MARYRQQHPLTIVLVVIAVLFIGFVMFLFSLPFLLLAGEPVERGNIALVRVVGPIVGDTQDSLLFGPGATSSSQLVNLIQEAEENEEIKGILVEINSPGGTPVASEEIATALTRTEKPTVAVIRDVGASGAYWVASAADHVIASPVSVTGSIGVIGSYLELSELFEEYGVGYERLVAGEHKDIGTPFRNLTDDERALMQSVLDSMHEDFIQSVAENRGMAVDDVRPVATGRIFTGRQAVNAGLVDELGGRQEAENVLKQMTGENEIEIAEYRVHQGLFGSVGLRANLLPGFEITT